MNPNAQEILGVKVYPVLVQVPEPVDLAVVVLPVGMILDTMRECADRGLKQSSSLQAGFVRWAVSVEIERKRLISRAHGMRVIDQTAGTMDMRSGLNTTFIKGMPPRGPIAFISQSGAVCGVVDSS